MALGRCLRTILGVKRGNWFWPVMKPDVTARKKVEGAGYPMQACTNRTYVALFMYGNRVRFGIYARCPRGEWDSICRTPEIQVERDLPQ